MLTIHMLLLLGAAVCLLLATVNVSSRVNLLALGLLFWLLLDHMPR